MPAPSTAGNNHRPATTLTRSAITAASKSHEDDHDGDAVPDQTRISGLEMIVGRAERGQDQTGKHHEEEQATYADHGEGDVRDYISEVRDAEPGSVVGEAMVGERLRDRRKE